MNKPHINKEYERELAQLRNGLMHMANQVEEMIVNATQSFVHQDLHLAKRTIELDRFVNRDEMELDELCLVLLATRQPVGFDLRFITIALKMVTDLERIGDLAVNICGRVIKLDNAIHPSGLHPSLVRMAGVAQTMIKEAILSFVEANAEQAAKVIERDDSMDTFYHQVSKDLLAYMKHHDGEVESLMHIHAIAKWLERIGDHCVNLAELVVFMVHGKDIRHSNSVILPT